MDSLEKTENKVKFMVGLFKFHQPTLNIVEQVALLTVWEESCVLQEEYEIAEALLNEMSIIQNNPSEVPQKYDSDVSYGVVEKKVTKKPFYFKFFKWVKRLFKNKV
jgi:hypothetical protein